MASCVSGAGSAFFAAHAAAFFSRSAMIAWVRAATSGSTPGARPWVMRSWRSSAVSSSRRAVVVAAFASFTSYPIVAKEAVRFDPSFSVLVWLALIPALGSAANARSSSMSASAWFSA